MAQIYTDEHGWRHLNPEVQARIDAEAEQAAIERAESVDALKAQIARDVELARSIVT